MSNDVRYFSRLYFKLSTVDKMYEFTQEWFESSEIKKFLIQIYGIRSEHHILEIGSYEGGSACFFSDVFLNHPNSSLFCVDPFSLEDTTSPLSTETEIRFRANIVKSKHPSKVVHFRMTSKEFFMHNTMKFDLIYIDGSHLLEDITIDFYNSLQIAQPGCIIWMDDYAGGPAGVIQQHIDSLIEANKDRVSIIFVGYQIALRVVGINT